MPAPALPDAHAAEGLESAEIGRELRGDLNDPCGTRHARSRVRRAAADEDAIQEDHDARGDPVVASAERWWRRSGRWSASMPACTGCACSATSRSAPHGWRRSSGSNAASPARRCDDRREARERLRRGRAAQPRRGGVPPGRARGARRRLGPVLAKHPEYAEHKIIERICEPERQIIFRVPWQDDRGEVQINRGFRVEFNSALGPVQGRPAVPPVGQPRHHQVPRLRADRSRTRSPACRSAAARAAADFDPKGRSDGEVMRFCQSFMTELYRHLGEYTDVPAGDIGVGASRDRLPVRAVQADHQPLRVRGDHRQGHRLGRGAGAHRGNRVRRGRTSSSEMLAGARRRARRQDVRRVGLGQRRHLRDREAAAAGRHGRGLLGLRRASCTIRARHRPRAVEAASRRSSAAASATTPTARGTPRYVARRQHLGRRLRRGAAVRDPERARPARDARRSWQRLHRRRRGREHAVHARGACGSSPRPAWPSARARPPTPAAWPPPRSRCSRTPVRDSWTFEHTERRLRRDHGQHPRRLLRDGRASSARPANYVLGPTSPASNASPRPWSPSGSI